MALRTWLRLCLSFGGLKPDWLMGCIAAFTFLVPAIIGLATGLRSSVLIVPLVAFMVVNMMPRDTWLTRRITSGLIGSVAASIVVFCSLEVSPWVVVSAVLFALLAFLFGLFVVFGRAMITTAIILPVVATIGFANPGTSARDAFVLAVGAFLGGVWAVVVNVMVALLRREHPVAQGISHMYVAVAAHTDAVNQKRNGISDADVSQARQASTTAILHALDLTQAPFVAPNWVRSRLDASRSEVARGIAVNSWLVDTEFRLHQEESVATESIAALKTVDEWCLAAASATATGSASPSPIPAAVDSGRGQPMYWTDVNPWELLKVSVSPGSACIKNAGRLGIAALVAGLLAGWFDSEHGWWIAITVVVVLKAGIGDTLNSVSRRIFGTVCGALIAVVLSQLLAGHNYAVMVTIAVIAIPMVALHWVNYTYWAAGISIFILLTMVIDAPALTWATSAERIAGALIGSAICVAATLWLWPSRSSREIPKTLAAQAKITADYLNMAADDATSAESLAQGRSAAVIGETNLQLLLRGTDGEPGDATVLAESARPVVGNLRYTRDVISAFARDYRANPGAYAEPDLRVARQAAHALAEFGSTKSAPVAATSDVAPLTREVVIAVQRTVATAR